MRVKGGLTSHKRHLKLRNQNKGFRGSKSKLNKVAHEARLHAGQYAFVGRKDRKNDFRKLWIVRISEALNPFGLNYSKFINNLAKANIKLNRKILADLVVNSPETFKQIVDKSKNIS